jgi:hypothetical protein
MHRTAITKGLAIAAVLVLGGASAAVAERPEGVGPPEDHGHGHSQGQGQSHGQGASHSNAGDAVVMYVFKGSYAGASTVNAGAFSVTVDHGNAHVKKANLIGPVDFDLSSATFVVADNNSDTVVDASDVASGDRVVVKARMPRKDPGQQPFVARQLVDQTNQPAP